MAQIDVLSTGPALDVDCTATGATVTNHGPSTVYYRDEYPVTTSTNDGSLAAGASATLYGQQWLAVGADARARVGFVGLSAGVVADVAALSAARGINATVPPYNAPRDGASNASAAIQSAIDAAAGREVYLPAGTYRLDSTLAATSAIRLRGDGRGRTIIRQNFSGNLVTVTGSKGSSVATSANVAAGATTVTLTSAAGFTAKDWILIRSTKAWPGGEGNKYGEIARIKSIATDTLTLYGPLGEAYTTADSTVVEKLTLVEGVVCEDVTFENPAPDTRTGSGVILTYCLHPTVNRCEFEGLDGAGAMLDTCVGGVVSDCAMRDLTDNIGAGRPGYGVNIAGATRGTVINAIHGSNCRHVITTNGTTDGVPRHCLISNSVATECSAAAFDTHASGRYITFSDCRVYGMANEVAAFNVRCRDVTIKNPVVESGNAVGVWVTEDTAGQSMNCRVVGGTFRDIYTQRAFRLEGGGVSIESCLLQNIGDVGIYIASGMGDMTFKDVTIRSCGTSSGSNWGIQYAGAPQGTDLFQDLTMISVTRGINYSAGSPSVSPYVDRFFGRSVTTLCDGYEQVMREIRVAVNINLPSTADGAVSHTAVTAAGARVGDVVAVNHNGALTNGAILTGQVTANDTVTVTFHNKTGGVYDPGAGAVRITVFRQ